MKKFFSLLNISLFFLGLSLFSTATFAYSSYRIDYKGEVVRRPVIRHRKPICPPKPIIGLRDGFYAGIAGGYDNYRVQALDSASIGIATTYTNPIISPAGFLGGLFIGAGHYFDLFYLGGEVFGKYSSATTTYTMNVSVPAIASAVAYYTRVTAKGSLGGSLMPGFKANPNTLVYGRLGYTRAYLQSNETLAANGVSLSDTTTNWSNGFTYGIGTEILICNRTSARGEYTYTKYSSYQSSLGTKFRPSDNQFLLGLVYHFS